MSSPIGENELWLLSFYRVSEISGALFFGRLARTIAPGPIQRDMTKHFADESQHAWFWTDCIERLGAKPLKLGRTYQDQYLSEAGLPANTMEILALTQVFEKRVANQYARHMAVPELRSEVRETIERIIQDERWHIRWVGEALVTLESEYGQDEIERTLARFRDADQRVYQKTLAEHEQHVKDLVKLAPR
jgi:hypothetical protein